MADSATMKKVSATGGVKKDWSAGRGIIPGREVLGPLMLMITTPCFAIVFVHVCTHLQGDFLQFAQLCAQQGLVSTLWAIWPDPWNPLVWRMILSFMAFELLLMKIVPGRRFEASLTPQGHRPVYQANGTACYIITLVTLWALAHFEIFDPALIYDYHGQIISSMNVFAWIFCAMLLIKGHLAPSTADSGTNGSMIQDFYWGMDLYPRIAGWDVKLFTNCRAGLMFWAVAIIAYCYKNMQLHQGVLQPGMAASVAIQLIYLTKFYHWEMGYMCSMDIQHDRAGYYICWGCLVWVPAVYTSQAFYLAAHAPDLSPFTALMIFLAGATCVWINYDSDRQRYVFRQTNGQCRIWGHYPPRHIVAQYQTANGQTKSSLLLVDGWWQISRHFHYVPEILASFFWSVSAWDSAVVAPYFYVFYLTILLTDRAFRDDDRCRSKYGPYWEQYCAEVPYKIVPGII